MKATDEEILIEIHHQQESLQQKLNRLINEGEYYQE